MNDNSHLFTSNNNLRKRTRAGEQAGRIHPLDGRKLGTESHRVIADLLASNNSSPTHRELLVAADRYASAREQKQKLVYRQSARQHLITTSRLYFERFLPPEDWTFLGAEIAGPGCRFDLVWLDAKSRYWVDELKTGRSAGHAGTTSLEKQLKRQHAGGLRLWAGSFGGIRACVLHAPNRSLQLFADGTRTSSLSRRNS